MKNNFKKAFTLVEMLIVVIIIGILIVALLPKFTGAQASTRDVARKANIATISTAFIQYFDQEGSYPTGSCMSSSGAKDAIEPFLTDIPVDPQKSRKTYGTIANGCGSGSYGYLALTSNGAKAGGAVIVANLENFGKGPNFVLSGTTDTTFSASNETSTLTKKRCEQGVKKADNTVYCTENKKYGEVKEQNQTAFVIFN